MQKYLKSHITSKDWEKGADKTMAVLATSYMFVYYILPQYFGIPLPFFDLTAQRIFIVISLIYIIGKEERKKRLLECLLILPGNVWLLLYFIVLTYTAVLRAHPGTFLYSFVEILAMLIVIYFIREYFGVRQFINLLIKFAYILCLLGIVEYVIKRSPFAYLETIKGLYAGAQFRSGSYRISGPANHPLGYGLMLITMLPFASLDMENDELDMFRHPILFALITINVLLTGSRSTLAVFGVELIVIFVLSSRGKKKKTFFVGVAFLISLALLVVATWGTSVSTYIMRQITSIIDELFDTTYSVQFGADIRTLTGSSDYRSYLPQIFTLSWLSPVLGRGSQYAFSWYIPGVITIASVDNFYVCLFIRYAYPGMVTYVLYALSNVLKPLIAGFKMKSGFAKTIAIGSLMYFVNLWWLDTLQTIKYVYIIFAVWVACIDPTTKEIYLYGEKETNQDITTNEVSQNKVSYFKLKKKK